MKKRFSLGLLGVLFLSSAFAYQPLKKGYTIAGTLTGDVNGKQIILKDSHKKVLDSALVVNGSFYFKGKVQYPDLYTLIILKDDKDTRLQGNPVIPVFIENSAIKITGVYDSLSREYLFKSGRYDHSHVKIEGSASHSTYMEYLSGYQPLVASRKEAFNNYIAYLNSGNNLKELVPQGIALVNAVDKEANGRDQFTKKYIIDHPESLVSIFIARDQLSSFSKVEIDEIISKLSPELLKTGPGKSLLAKAAQLNKSSVGTLFPDFTLADDKGNPVKLSDYAGKGKYVLLEFWASWCGPCRADIPHLKYNYGLYHPEGFEVISISMDENKEAWLKAVGEEKMSWLQLSDLKGFKGGLSSLYNFSGIPACILIDPNGVIVSRNMRGSWMDRKLIEMYGNKF